MLLIKVKSRNYAYQYFLKQLNQFCFYVGMIIVFIKCDHNVNYEIKWNEMVFCSL